MAARPPPALTPSPLMAIAPNPLSLTLIVLGRTGAQSIKQFMGLFAILRYVVFRRAEVPRPPSVLNSPRLGQSSVIRQANILWRTRGAVNRSDVRTLCERLSASCSPPERLSLSSSWPGGRRRGQYVRPVNQAPLALRPFNDRAGAVVAGTRAVPLIPR